MFGIISVLIIPAFIFLPIIIALIYKIFYNKHINSGKGRKWISPLSAGLISFIVLTIAAVTAVSAAFVSYKFSPERYLEMDTTKNTSVTLTEEEFKNSAFTAFNGRGVSGYKLENKKTDDFDYQLYSKVNGGPVSMPDYVIIITYTGDKEYASAYAENKVIDKSGGSSQGEGIAKSKKYYAVIDGSNIVYKDKNGKTVDIKYSLAYSLKLNPETDEALLINGEIQPAASFEIELN